MWRLLKRLGFKLSFKQALREYRMAFKEQMDELVSILDTLADKINAIPAPTEVDLTPIAEAAKGVADAVVELEKRVAPVV